MTYIAFYENLQQETGSVLMPFCFQQPNVPFTDFLSLLEIHLLRN